MQVAPEGKYIAGVGGAARSQRAVKVLQPFGHA